MNISVASRRLQQLCTAVPPLLNAISDADFAASGGEGKWSKQQLLGHLIDSATNNHQRIVRGQFEELPLIWYNQDAWIKYSYYESMEPALLVSFWEVYNRWLVALINALPEEKLHCKVDWGGSTPLSIANLFSDYVEHLEYHLRQILPNQSIA